jgi:hypothetical protein
MRPPTFVGQLAAQDRQHLEAGLRSPDAFTLWRSQILLASDHGYRPSQAGPLQWGVGQLGSPRPVCPSIIWRFTHLSG